MISLSVANPYEYTLDYQALKAAARAVLEGEGVPAAKLGIAFVDNPHIHRLNNQFLQHDEPTDVLTFPYSVRGSKKLEGEIVIGFQVAEEQAKERGHALEHELTLYVIHGCLHLCGYHDHTERLSEEMRKRERHYLALLGLPDIAGE